MKKTRYAIEAALVYFAFGIFKILGPRGASAFGGWIGRTVGPHLGATKKALTNIRAALPDTDDAQQHIIIRDMWDNLGRVMAEYPHLKTIARRNIDITGLENVPRDGTPFVFITAHAANWEVPHIALFLQAGIRCNITYREPNNVFVGKLLESCRRVEGQLPMLPKSRAGTRGMVETMSEGNPLLILIDQKYNEGPPVPFFGRPAMTSDAFVRFARKFDAPIIPLHLERVAGNRFHLRILPPLPAGERETQDVIADAHALLEGWIRQRPGQWLWLHRRRDSAALK